MSTPSPWSNPSGPAEPERTKPKLSNAMAIATELWLVVILGQAVAYLGQYSSLADSVRRSASEGTSQAERDLVNNTAFVIAVYIAGALVLTVISVFLVWLARNGYQWARLTLTFISAFLVIQTVFALFDSVGPRWVTIPSVLSGVAALGAAYLLAQKECEVYCTEMAEYRRARRPFAAAGPGLPPGQPGPYPPASYPPGPYPPGPYPPASYPPGPYPPASYPPASSPPAPPYPYPPNGPYPYAQPPHAPNSEPTSAAASDQPSLMEPDSPMPDSPPGPWNGGTNPVPSPAEDPTEAPVEPASDSSVERAVTDAPTADLRPSLVKGDPSQLTTPVIPKGTDGSDDRARGENVRERTLSERPARGADEEAT